MVILKVWISDSFTSHKAHYYATYNTEFSPIVRPLNLLIHLTECYDMESHIFGDHLNVIRVWIAIQLSYELLTALLVLFCKIRYDSENFPTNRHLRTKTLELAFSLHSLSVTFVTSTCSLSLSNCDTALAANSVSSKCLISGSVWLYNFKEASALHFRRHQLGSFSPVVRLNM